MEMTFTHNTFIVTSIIAMLSMVFLLYTDYKIYRSGRDSATLFFFVQTTFLSLFIIFLFMTVGELEYRLITKHELITVLLLEIFVFSLAIENRFKKYEKEEIGTIKQANKALDKKVQERILELESCNKKLEELASRDPLTNLFNRRFLYEMGQELVLIAKRQKTAVSVVLFDIDNFKSINDTFGHDIGDEVIFKFASLLQQTRECDIAARIGGEEFLLVLPNTSEAGALEIANQLLNNTKKIMIDTLNTRVCFTVSAGISHVFTDNDSGIELAIHRADQALYQAKKNGKNQIQIFTENAQSSALKNRVTEH